LGLTGAAALDAGTAGFGALNASKTLSCGCFVQRSSSAASNLAKAPGSRI
jgi:hypothetical protein